MTYTELDLKHKYYNMMLQKWKHTFLSSGLDISNVNYSILKLKCSMSIQEAAYNASNFAARQRPRKEYTIYATFASQRNITTHQDMSHTCHMRHLCMAGEQIIKKNCS